MSVLKDQAKLIAGYDIKCSVQLECEMHNFGDGFEGWCICPTGIGQDSVVYSFGVGTDVSFDLGLIEKYGCAVHAFDPTPKSIQWVKLQKLPDKFMLHEYGLAAHDGTVKFFPPENAEHVSHTVLERPGREEGAFEVPVKRLATIMKELGHDRIDILKMDIEGAEYDVLDDMIASNIRPQQVLVEFHHQFKDVHAKRTKVAIKMLNKAGYALFYISGSKRELSFILR